MKIINYIQHLANSRASICLRTKAVVDKDSKDYPNSAVMNTYIARDVRSLFLGRGVSVSLVAINSSTADTIQFTVTVTIARGFKSKQDIPTTWQEFYSALGVDARDIERCVAAATQESFDKATQELTHHESRHRLGKQK